MAGAAKHAGLRRQWLELRLLCRPGIGLAAIAPQLCRLAREIVGAEAASLFWLDREGMPLGFFHEDSPEAACDLFINEFDRLFVGPDEINVFALAQRQDAACGHLLAPPASYFRSNTYNLLVRASGHHHCLDLRIDDAEGARAVLLLFRGQTPAFTDQDVGTVLQFMAPLRRAGMAGDIAHWHASEGPAGHVLIDPEDLRILAMSDAADALLRASNLVGQGLTLVGPLVRAPAFLAELCGPAMATGRASADLEVPGGRLVLEASVIRSPLPDQLVPAQVLVQMSRKAPADVALLDPILDLRLSPLRSEILFYAASGGRRDLLSRNFAISKESAKKHLAEIYRAMNVGHWDELATILRRDSGGGPT